MADLHSGMTAACDENGDVPEASSDRMLRTKIARVIEIDLKCCRHRAEILGDPLMLYLIDIALLQLQRKWLQTMR
jgi:hypothetical protein